ncbi:MAG: hypothetical protein ACKVWV_12365 [Planctomycetota bacterium]
MARSRAFVPMGSDVEELRDEILVPVPRGAATPSIPARVVGPGRLERRYRARIESLEQDLAAGARSLDCAALVERGQARLLDRLERDVERERVANATLVQREKRLILALGGLQRENELLRLRGRPADRLEAASGPRTSARATRTRGERSWWSRFAARVAGHRDA